MFLASGCFNTNPKRQRGDLSCPLAVHAPQSHGEARPDMPIRFRCVYCDKLLGIARRKAGTIINCPHCAEKLIVPTPDPADTATDPEEGPVTGSTSEKAFAGAPPPLFEKIDIDAMLQGKPMIRPFGEPVFEPPKQKTIRTESGPGFPPLYSAPPAQAATKPGPSALGPVARPRGYYVSPAKATWLVLLMIVLLALAFGAGWLVRRSISKTSSKPSEAATIVNPAKTAEIFFEGLIHEQWSAAYETLDPESRAWCTEDEFIKRAKTYLNKIGFKATNVKVTTGESGDEATAVAVYVGPSAQHFEDGATLHRTAGGWRVVLRKNFGNANG